MEPNLKLRGLRVSKGYTQEDVAKMMGVNRNTYSSKEQGKKDFTASEMIRIAEFLGAEPGDIFFKS